MTMLGLLYLAGLISGVGLSLLVVFIYCAIVLSSRISRDEERWQEHQS